MRKVIAGLLLGLGASAIALLLGATGALDTAELKAYDWRVRRTADANSVSKDIVLVEINDTSIRDLAKTFGRWPWPRVGLGYRSEERRVGKERGRRETGEHR